MTPRLALGPGAEFDRIRLILDRLGDRAPLAGGDSALLSLGNLRLAVSCDMSVEGRHFRTDWLALEEIGWRAAAVALSDLAAVGAEAIGLMASVGVPSAAAASDPARVMDGVGAAVSSVGGIVMGGDLISSPLWIVDVTVLGRVDREVTRAGARSGDAVWVSGALGASRAALAALLRGEPPTPEIRRAFARPLPRLALGRQLVAVGATAMIDLSDGLGGDAGHLAAASECSVVIDLDRVPVAAGVPEEAGRLGLSPVAYAAAGGEDYELLFTLPPEVPEAAIAAIAGATGVSLTRIGQVESGTGAHCRFEGRDQAIHGFDHFA